MLWMLPNQMRIGYHWYFDHCCDCRFVHRSILLHLERIHPLVVCTSCSLVPRPTYRRNYFRHQILHQGLVRIQNQIVDCYALGYLLIHPSCYLESHLLPMAIQIWHCLRWSWCHWIHHANQESIHGLELVHWYLPWLRLGLLPLRCYHLCYLQRRRIRASWLDRWNGRYGSRHGNGRREEGRGEEVREGRW